MGRPELEAFLTHLAIKEQVFASTQNQALSAILFLYRTVLATPLDFPIDAVRAQRPPEAGPLRRRSHACKSG